MLADNYFRAIARLRALTPIGVRIAPIVKTTAPVTIPLERKSDTCVVTLAQVQVAGNIVPLTFDTAFRLACDEKSLQTHYTAQCFVRA